jgi:succinoglycan biosynthesis transport protein ExoP
MSNPENFTSNLDEGPLVNWQDLWRIGVRHYRLFLWCFVPTFLLTLIYVLVAPRVYESRAVVQVEQQPQGAFSSTEKSTDTDDSTSEDSIKTIEQNLQSYGLFLNVVSNPEIADDPNFLIGYHGNKNPAVVSDLAEWLQAHTQIALRHGTRLIDVTVDHQVPVMAQKLAQSIIDSFTLMNTQAQNFAQQGSLKFLVSESKGVKDNFQKSENSLQIYKDLLLLKQRIDEQQHLVDSLKQRYREKHPKLIQARMLLAGMLQDFDTEFKKVIASSPSEAAYWASNSSDLASAAPDDRVSTELKLVEARSEVLQKEVDTESALFDNVLRQMRETDVSQDSAATNIHLVEPPVVPTKAAKPKKGIVLLLGAAMGALLGAGAVFLAHSIDTSIQTPMEAEKLLDLPVLGTIPQLPSKKAATAPPASLTGPPRVDPGGMFSKELVVVTDPGGAAAEGFRSLRTVLNLLGKVSENRSILLTSALPGEGKTFVSCNYALSLAQEGSKTLLVDTDLRRPSVQGRFNLKDNVGFGEVLAGTSETSRAVYRNVAKNLDVLIAGGKCPNPAELLAGPAFKEFLKKALASYDRVVFDSSPLNLVSDSLLIATDVDLICLVVRAASTLPQAPHHALTLLRLTHKKPAGIILNGIHGASDRQYRGYKGNDAGAYGQVYSS